jgi:hypothetical protein
MKNEEYLRFENMDKNDIQQSMILEFVALAESNSRVASIKQLDDTAQFNIISDELSGTYSMGRIAGLLCESESEQKERLASERIAEPDDINISELSSCKFQLSRRTIKKLHEYALTQESGIIRAQCYTIASYDLLGEETIAERFLRDHAGPSHAIRQAQIMVLAGCANETNKVKGRYGKITFEDGSSL